MERYQEIQAHRATMAKQFAGCFSNTDEIRKGEITDRLANGWGSAETALKFKKTGAEIKEKLPTIESTLNNAKMVLVAEMAGLKSTIGIEPTEEHSSKKFKMLRYPYKMTERPWDPIGRVYLEATEQQTCCDKYNDLCWKLLDIEEDLQAIKVIAANLDDSKSYELSVSQLVALCFND